MFCHFKETEVCHKNVNYLQTVEKILKSTLWHNVNSIASIVQYEENTNKITLLNQAALKKLTYESRNLLPKFSVLARANISDKSDNLVCWRYDYVTLQ